MSDEAKTAPKGWTDTEKVILTFSEGCGWKKWSAVYMSISCSLSQRLNECCEGHAIHPQPSSRIQLYFRAFC